MPYEMPGALSSKDKAPKKDDKRTKSRIAAAALAGALSQAPNALAQEDVENHEAGNVTFTQPEKVRSMDGIPYEGQSITYSGYIAGERLRPVTDEEKIERLTRERNKRRSEAFQNPVEIKFNTQVKNAREALGMNEIAGATRMGLHEVFNKLTAETGANVHPLVQLGGSLVIKMMSDKIDSKLSGVISSAVFKSLSPQEQAELAIINNATAAKRMMFKYHLGSKDWKLTFGADPGAPSVSRAVFGEEKDYKFKPKVGVTFEYVVSK